MPKTQAGLLDIKVFPATAERWNDIEILFGPKGKGVMTELLRGAMRYAVQQGAQVIEGVAGVYGAVGD